MIGGKKHILLLKYRPDRINRKSICHSPDTNDVGFNLHNKQKFLKSLWTVLFSVVFANVRELKFHNYTVNTREFG